MHSIEARILTLQSARMFAETPAPILVEVANLLEELEFSTGQTIFAKGDPGTSMYFILKGKVQVHDGDLVLNYLESGQVFGEMAVLDPAPRIASVTAIEDTCVLRLEGEAVFELMAQRPEVVRGLIHVLVQHLRARVRDIYSDFEYMRQFAKVTAAAVALEAGVYQPESLDEVAQRADALGNLARVFQRMAAEVYTREQRLKQEVLQLRIEIDEVRKARQVAEISESDYFQQLRSKARKMRGEQ